MIHGVIGAFFLGYAPLEKPINGAIPDLDGGGPIALLVEAGQPVTEVGAVPAGQAGEAEAAGEVREQADRIFIDSQSLWPAPPGSQGQEKTSN